MPNPKPQHTPEEDMTQELNVGIADYLFSVVKPATETIKRYPFYYTVVLLALCVCDIWLPAKLTLLLGLLFLTSIPSAIFCFILSRQVNLCKWHRAQCVVMLLPLFIPIYRVFCPDCNIKWVCGIVIVVLLLTLLNRFNITDNLPSSLAEWREDILKQLTHQPTETNNN